MTSVSGESNVRSEFNVSKESRALKDLFFWGACGRSRDCWQIRKERGGVQCATTKVPFSHVAFEEQRYLDHPQMSFGA